jgi:hypothetical protein
VNPRHYTTLPFPNGRVALNQLRAAGECRVWERCSIGITAPEHYTEIPFKTVDQERQNSLLAEGEFLYTENR